MQKKDHKIRNHVLIGVAVLVIGGVILASIKSAREIAIGILKWLFGAGVSFWNHLGATMPVPWWAVYAVAVVLMLLVWLRVKHILNNWAAEDANDPLLAYTEDRFFGLVWRWWMDSNYYPRDISTYCPACDMKLRPRQPGDGCSTEFYCNKCASRVGTMEMEREELKELVVRAIQIELLTKQEELSKTGVNE